MLEIVCNGSICVCFVLTCIATNIKISTSWFDVNFYFVYFIAPIITSHIIYLATNIHNISLKVLSSYALLISMHVAISMTTCLECESLSLNACVNLCCNALRHYVSRYVALVYKVCNDGHTQLFSNLGRTTVDNMSINMNIQ